MPATPPPISPPTRAAMSIPPAPPVAMMMATAATIRSAPTTTPRMEDHVQCPVGSVLLIGSLFSKARRFIPSGFRRDAKSSTLSGVVKRQTSGSYHRPPKFSKSLRVSRNVPSYVEWASSPRSLATSSPKSPKSSYASSLVREASLP